MCYLVHFSGKPYKHSFSFFFLTFCHSTHPFINSCSYEKWNLARVERIDFVYMEGGGALCSFHKTGCNSSCKRDVMIRRSLKTSRSCNKSEVIGKKVVNIIMMML